jgi:uncharacterized phage protein gp47/JayE
VFQVKNFASITASIVNYMKSVTTKITDFSVGSVARTLVEAPATEIDELYQKVFVGLREAIPVAIYRAFEFDALSATSSGGTIRVTITPSEDDVLISAGTTFTLDGGSEVVFSNADDTTIVAGDSYADVTVTAVVAGTSGNIAALQSFTVQPTVDGMQSATNLASFTNGTDDETDDERKARFTAYVSSLARGTTAAIEYGLSTVTVTDSSDSVTEQVVSSTVVEPWLTDENEPIALVRCYIHNGGSGASSELLARAKEVIDGYYDGDTAVPGWKAAGVKVEIYAATNVSFDVTASLVAESGYTVSDLVTSAETAIDAYLSALSVGEDALLSEVIAAVMAIDGVYNFTVSSPVADLVVASTEKAVTGVLSISGV